MGRRLCQTCETNQKKHSQWQGENSRVGVRENIVRMRATARQEWWSRKENCKGVRITQWQHGNSRAAEAVGHLLRCVQSIQGESINWVVHAWWSLHIGHYPFPALQQ